jgi:predicted amidohydrolase
MGKDLLFINGCVLLKDFVFHNCDVAVRNGKISEIGSLVPKSEEIIDLKGRYLIPGLIDTHLHGAVGESFLNTTMEGIRKIAVFEAEQGVTAITPTISSATDERTEAAMRVIIYNKLYSIHSKLFDFFQCIKMIHFSIANQSSKAVGTNTSFHSYYLLSNILVLIGAC